ncbi:hypothetical protein BH18ACT17_BH18ACT17_03320 [soil metagenome]
MNRCPGGNPRFPGWRGADYGDDVEIASIHPAT